MTPQEVASIYSKRLSYVYRVASRDHWRRVHVGNHVLYNRDDVDRSFGRD